MPQFRAPVRTDNVRVGDLSPATARKRELAKPLRVGDNLGPRMHARALAAAFLTFGVGSAHAAVSDIPPECGSRAAFDQELRSRLGNDAPTTEISVVITAGTPHSHLRVQIGSEVRELDDPSCTELFRASVVIAVAMLGRDSRPPSPAPEPAPNAPPKLPRNYPRLSVGAGAGLSVGTLPDPVLALELESKALWRYLGVSANLRYLLPADETTPTNRGVKLRALGAGLSGIFRPSRSWEARLGFAAQRLAGEGNGRIAQQGRDSAWAAGPTLGLAFVPFQAEGFWAGLGAEGQLNAIRGQFEILNYYQPVSSESYVIYEVPWLSGSAFVRLGLVW